MADGQKARIPNVLSIAGIDPSGGAGLLADVKAISACGAYACATRTQASRARRWAPSRTASSR